ncbi:neurotensin receptor type 2-like [Aplysia californica]|uniref:Neurotensin receptor type 2-like n=1 Tax=Aplysia californica TaxID=6500 RepID=A0ABM1W0A8_APLCA|nr:neurotensin receptor type 2-like [Aplysia californica]
MNVSVILGVFVCVAGLVMNSLSTSVFLRQDWRKNTVTVTLLSLTVYFFTWPRSMFYDISSCTTVLVSLERCLCVVLPLKVNSLLTPRRVKMLLFLVWGVGLATYIPVFSSQFLVWKSDLATNMTVLTVGITSYRLKVETAHNIINTLFLQTVCQVTVVVNTVVMTSGLNRSKKFQKHSGNMRTAETSEVSSPAAGQNDGEPPPPVHVSRLHRELRQGHKTTGESHELKGEGKVAKKGKVSGTSAKYKRTIKVVSGVSCLFIICNTPLLVAVYMKNLAPGYDFGQKHQYEFLLTLDIVFLTTAVNAASNFMVYTVFNKKFRDDLLRLCGGEMKS